MQTYDRIIVGAGIAGLSEAWWRTQNGENVVVLEATDRVGGVIHTDRVDGFQVERAASTIPSTALHVQDLAAAVPGAPKLVPASKAATKQFLLGRGGLRAVPRSPPALFETGLLSPGAKLRALMEMLRRMPRNERSRASLQGFVGERFGREVADAFLRPFTQGIYGTSPEQLGAFDAFPALVAGARRRNGVLRSLMSKKGGAKRRVLLPKGGMEALPKAIAAVLGERVRTNATVETLAPGAPDRSAEVVLSGGETLRADEIVLCVPASAQGRLLEAVPHVAEALTPIPYVPIGVAAVGFRREDAPAVPEGFGFLRSRSSKARILGATFVSKLSNDVAPLGCELLNVYFGGGEDPEFVNARDDDVRDQVLRDLGRALGGRVRPRLFDLWRWPAAIPVFAPGHRARMAALNTELDRSRIRLSGSHVTGVGLDACCRPAAPVPAPGGVTRV